ncbi:hypothetical protein OXX69_005733 [Metschnikowia pulcherrima]
MSAPAESLLSILGDIVTKKRKKLDPATTKMLAVVKDMTKKIRPDDIESGVDSDDEYFVDDAELCSQITQEMNESDDVEMEVDSNENNSVRILLDEYKLFYFGVKYHHTDGKMDYDMVNLRIYIFLINNFIS